MKFFARIGAFALLLAMLLSLVSCGAPALDEVQDTFKTLIEESYRINEIFFGEGLSTYDRDEQAAAYAYLPDSYALYEIIDVEAGYLTVDNIKAAAEKVYSRDYLEGIYMMAFDGYADGEAVTTARYLEMEGYFLRYAAGAEDPFDILEGKQRRFLFDTMKIVRPSRKDYVNLKIDSYLLGHEDEILTITLRFVLQDGEWRLDSPTY